MCPAIRSVHQEMCEIPSSQNSKLKTWNLNRGVLSAFYCKNILLVKIYKRSSENSDYFFEDHTKTVVSKVIGFLPHCSNLYEKEEILLWRSDLELLESTSL